MKYGVVISSRDATPVHNAMVSRPSYSELAELGNGKLIHLGTTSPLTSTDMNGSFKLPEDHPSSVLIVSAVGFGQTVLERNWLGGTEEAPLTIRLTEAAQLKARITDLIGNPVQGCELQLAADAYYACQPHDRPIDQLATMILSISGKSDEQGRLTLSQVPAEVPFEVELRVDSKLVFKNPVPLVFSPGRMVEQEWKIGAGCVLTGRVIDQNDRPVSNCPLWITQRGLWLSSKLTRASLYSGDREGVTHHVDTNQDGRFQVDDVIPGRWWIGVAPGEDSGLVSATAEQFQVTERDVTKDILLREYRGLFLRGKLVDPFGAPIAGRVQATLQSDSTLSWSESYPSENGEFLLGPLEPGKYRIEGESNLSLDGHVAFAPSVPLVVSTGLQSELLVELRFGGCIHPIAVSRESGMQVPASFWLVNSTDPNSLVGSFEGDGAETVVLGGMAPGNYHLAAITADGQTGFVRNIAIRAGETPSDVRVLVERGAQLKLQYAGKSALFAEVELWSDSTYFGGDGIHQGTSATFVVPRGKVRVHWKADSEEFDEVVDLAAGEVRELSWPK